MNGDRSPLIILAAGGTGGHMFPADALAAVLKDKGCRLMLVTDRRGGELGGALGDMETHRIMAGGIAGKSFFRRMLSAIKLGIGTFQGRKLLKWTKPDAVIGFGGYASVPTMWGSSLGGYKTALHEQNAVLGRANRILAPYVGRIALSFEEVSGLPEGTDERVCQTGMPVRPSVIALRETPYPALRDGGPFNLFIFGGSQGASVFSDVVPEAVRLLDGSVTSRLSIVQQCRAEDMDRVEAAYGEINVKAELSPFFTDLPERLAAAHLVIGRAGASTIAELTCIGRPAILVPYAHAADDHQSFNAHALDEAGGGWLMPEDAFTPESLSARLAELVAIPATLEKAACAARAAGRPDAAERLAEMVLGLLEEEDGEKENEENEENEDDEDNGEGDAR